MSTTVANVAKQGATLAELRAFYYDRVISYVSGHDQPRTGPARETAYAAASTCVDLVEQLERANDALLAATRALR